MRKDIFNTPESGTYNPQTGKHDQYRVEININTGEIVATGKRTPPPEWIPEGWVQFAVNRWLPPWPACMYRRLNVYPWKHKPPEIQPLCIKYNPLGEEITPQVCMDCKVFKVQPIRQKELPKGVSIHELFTRSWLKDTDEQQIVFFHPLENHTEEELDYLEEQVFQKTMENVPPRLRDPRHPRNRRQIQFRWVPCIHRIEEKKSLEEISSGCGGCGNSRIVCNNPKADAFGEELRRSICKNCPVAEPPDGE